MAGGKETPRQKMIGMMYLVLTALLALNVSKQVLDAFVAIEENMQKAAINHLERGDGAKRSLSGELTVAEKDKEDPTKVKAQKIKYFMDVMNKIDVETGKFIEMVDGIKKDILTKSGEDMSVGDKDASKILWVDYNKKEPIRPSRMNLAAVQAKDQYDIPMHELVGEEPMTPKADGAGMKLWKAYNDYRLNIVKLLGTYTVGGKTWSINPVAINKFKDFNDLTKQVEAMIEKSQCNKNDDKGKLRDLYIELTKPEMVMAGGEGEEQKEWPWIGKTFDHAPLVAAIASLTSLQVEILAARASAFEHIKSRVSTGEFSFNSIEGFAVGPTMVTKGDEAELKVMMAAFDTDNQPVISGGGNWTVANGQGTMKIATSGIGDKTISGTVKIRKKSGDWAEKPWKYTVKVIEPTGSISLPDMQILYKNYSNNVQAVASGFDKTDLKITSGTATKTTKGSNNWVIFPTGGNSLTLAVVGTNSITKKSATLNSVTYKVKPLPDPGVYLGGKKNTESVNKNVTSIQVKYGSEITLTGVTFPISGWTLIANGRETSGTGTELNAQAINMMKQSSGKYVTLVVNYKKPDKTVTKGSGTFKVN
jgi:hypothetical protein